MRTAKTNRRSIAQRARRDREHEEPRPGPPPLMHGEPIGRIVVEYRGQRVEATLLQAGERCRTLGVQIGGEPVQVMGLYRALTALSQRVARMPSVRSDFWSMG